MHSVVGPLVVCISYALIGRFSTSLFHLGRDQRARIAEDPQERYNLFQVQLQVGWRGQSERREIFQGRVLGVERQIQARLLELGCSGRLSICSTSLTLVPD